MTRTPSSPASDSDDRADREAMELSNALTVILATIQIVERDARRRADPLLIDRAHRIQDATQRIIKFVQSQQRRP